MGRLNFQETTRILLGKVNVDFTNLKRYPSGFSLTHPCLERPFYKLPRIPDRILF